MLVDDIAITMQPRLSAHTVAYLLQRLGSAEAVYRASKEQLIEQAELRDDVAAAIVKKSFHTRAEKEIKFCQKNEIVPIVSTSESYPRLLKECGDYPHVIYYKGDTTALARRSLSMVGTRKITSYGQRMCEMLVEGLAKMFPDMVVVSGLAFGVDGACHRAALAAGLTTVAVLGNPLSSVYPAQHASLAAEMIKRGGGLISEYHSGCATLPVNFIARNRIIAGMSMGTIVVEAPMKSGAVITANMADGYDRSVMAVPGRAVDAASEGCNGLIKSDRARMVCSAADIAAEMGWVICEVAESGKSKTRDLSALGKDAAGLYRCLPDGEPVFMDEIVEMTGLSVAELSLLLLELEFEKLVRPLPGKMYQKE